MTQINNDITKKVLDIITPSFKERKELEGVIYWLKTLITQEIEKRKLPINIELVGSTAKDTYLRKNLDIDLFLLYPSIISKEDIVKSTLSIGRVILYKPEECYAEHPYIRGNFKNYKVLKYYETKNYFTLHNFILQK